MIWINVLCPGFGHVLSPRFDIHRSICDEQVPEDAFRRKKGATAIEYGLVAALIAVAAIDPMQGIGTKLNSTFNNISNHPS
jgi:pilus assembly protein Flp/PilA